MRIQRRAATRWWTAERIAEQMRAVYRARSPVEGEGTAEVIGVVFHQDPRLVSRWQAWRQRNRGGLAPFCFFGIGWSEYQAGCVAMGDQLIPELLAVSMHQSEADARADAVRWIGDAAAGPIDHPPFTELEPFAQRALTSVARGENHHLLTAGLV